jgi:hypothetical protein
VSGQMGGHLQGATAVALNSGRQLFPGPSVKIAFLNAR